MQQQVKPWTRRVWMYAKAVGAAYRVSCAGGTVSREKRRKNIIIAIGIIYISIFFIWSIIGSINDARLRKYTISSSFSGKISFIEKYHGNMKFELENNTEIYVLIAKEKNGVQRFGSDNLYDYASIGDSIIHEKNSLFIKLIKKDRTIHFVIQR